MTEQTQPTSGMDVSAEPAPVDPSLVPDPETIVIQVDEGWYKGLDEATAEQAAELDQLLALYDRAEAEADEASERFEAVRAACKAIAYDLAKPGEDTRKVELKSARLHAPLEMIYVAGRKTLDRKLLQSTYPGLDLTVFEKIGKPSWSMRRGKTASE